MLIDKSEIFGKIKSLVKKRDDFLKEHPELEALQQKFNDLMKKAGTNKYNRCVLAQQFMMEYSQKLCRGLEGLKLTVDKLVEGCDNERSKSGVCQDGGDERHSRKDGL